ncbi:hypothetical protein KKB10_02790 [Patescibacteria group bacterium]|nr:hypothetical protein [Patescibacteria group bacterium]MBU1075218.1 hypothetical protein [Patescibacteria group bacterium]MBU1951994.1 hypothetical protein [Patescibacteria group bacterium]
MAKWIGKNIPDPAPKLFGKTTNHLDRDDLLRLAKQLSARDPTTPQHPELIRKLIYLVQHIIHKLTLDDLYQLAEIFGSISPQHIDGSVELYQFAEACNRVGHHIEKRAGRPVTIAFDPLTRKNEALILLVQRYPDLVSVYADRQNADLVVVKLEIPPTFGLHVPADKFQRDQVS